MPSTGLKPPEPKQTGLESGPHGVIREGRDGACPGSRYHLRRKSGEAHQEGEERLCMSVWVLCSQRPANTDWLLVTTQGQTCQRALSSTDEIPRVTVMAKRRISKVESCFDSVFSAFGPIRTEHCSECFQTLTHSLFPTA